MKKTKNRKKQLAIATVLATVLLIAAGTFAFTSYTEWAKNHFQSTGMEEGKVVIVDTVGDDPVVPGGKVKKEVSITNTGAAKSFVRVSLEEVANRLPDNTTIVKSPYPTELPITSNYPVIASGKLLFESDGTTQKFNAVPADKLIIGTTANTDSKLKLYVAAAGNVNNAILAREVTISKSDLPENFDPTTIIASNGQALAKDFTTATVLQKVGINDGEIKYNPSSGNYTVSVTPEYYYLSSSITATGAVHNYGDWAGEQVWKPTTSTDVPAKAALTDIKEANGVSHITSKVDSQITLDFGVTIAQALPAAAQLKNRDWFYNPDDGYFYFTGFLSDGETTPFLLTDVSFGVDKANLLSAYDLYVGLEAIPATKEALEFATKGGNFDKTSVTAQGTKPITWSATVGDGWGLTSGPIYDYFNSLAGLVN